MAEFGNVGNSSKKIVYYVFFFIKYINWSQKNGNQTQIKNKKKKKKPTNTS